MAQIGKARPNLGWTRPSFRGTRPNLAETCQQCFKVRPDLANFDQTWVMRGANSADSGQISATICHSSPKSARFRQTSCRFLPNLPVSALFAHTRPNKRRRMQSNSAEFALTSLASAPTLPRIGQSLPKSSLANIGIGPADARAHDSSRPVGARPR